MKKFFLILLIATSLKAQGLDTLFYATFEAGWNGFVGGGLETWERNTVSPIQGSYDLHMSNSAGTDVAVQTAAFTLIPGKTYNVSFKTRRASGGGQIIFRMSKGALYAAGAVDGWADTLITQTSNTTFSFTRSTTETKGYLMIAMGNFTEAWIDEILITYVADYVSLTAPADGIVQENGSPFDITWNTNLSGDFTLYIPAMLDTTVSSSPFSFTSQAPPKTSFVGWKKLYITSVSDPTRKDSINIKFINSTYLRIIAIAPDTLIQDRKIDSIAVTLESKGIDSVWFSYSFDDTNYTYLQFADITNSGSGLDTNIVNVKLNLSINGEIYLKAEQAEARGGMFFGHNFYGMNAFVTNPGVSCYAWKFSGWVRDYTCGWVSSYKKREYGTISYNLTPTSFSISRSTSIVDYDTTESGSAPYPYSTDPTFVAMPNIAIATGDSKLVIFGREIELEESGNWFYVTATNIYDGSRKILGGFNKSTQGVFGGGMNTYRSGLSFGIIPSGGTGGYYTVDTVYTETDTLYYWHTGGSERRDALIVLYNTEGLPYGMFWHVYGASYQTNEFVYDVWNGDTEDPTVLPTPLLIVTGRNYFRGVIPKAKTSRY